MDENKQFEVKVKEELEDESNCEISDENYSIHSVKQEYKQEFNLDCTKNENLTCDENSDGWANLEIHSTVHYDQRLFQCSECSVKTKYEDNLNKHILSMHPKTKSVGNTSNLALIGGRQVQNTIGHKNFSLQTAHNKKDLLFQNKKLENHEFINNTERFLNNKQLLNKRKYIYSCSNCSFHCNIRGDLIYHTYHYHYNNNSSQNEKLVCSHCYKDLHCHPNPKRHLDYCKNIEIVQCDYCLRYYKGKRNLQVHIFGIHFKDGIFEKDHPNQYKYILPACPKCGKKYKYQQTLSSHVAFCGKKLPFQCEICLFKTDNQYTLSNHILRHLKKSNLCQNL